MQNLRKILFPFSLLYGGIVQLRNKAFDWGWISSKSYDFPVICVGNLSVGGTGKSPMIEYLIRLLSQEYRLATLSRGYKRETSGFHLLSGAETAKEAGDEPLQFKTKFPDVQVAVDADRQHGIAQLMKGSPTPEVILLDDAFQHRKVKAGFSILLTSYDSIYASDCILPAGNLREPKSGAQRADIIVVSKCPGDLSKQKQQEIERKLKINLDQQVFFSYIKYAGSVINKAGKKLLFEELPKNFTLVTGIAKPAHLVDFLKQKNLDFNHLKFPDHHNFSPSELNELQKASFILTTEKDFMRLQAHFSADKLYYLPIEQDFLNKKNQFDTKIMNWIGSEI